MLRNDYERELRHLYGKANKTEDFRLAFEILQVGVGLGFDTLGDDANPQQEQE